MHISQFILYLFTNDVSTHGIIKEQYELAKHGISWEVSSCMSDFERNAVVNMIIEDYNNEAEQFKDK